MDKLDKGQCFFISKNEVFVEDNNVFIVAQDILFKVGEIPVDEVSWFGNQLNKDVVVYLGDEIYSFKRYTSVLEEFESMKDDRFGDQRDNILSEMLSEIANLKVKLEMMD